MGKLDGKTAPITGGYIKHGNLVGKTLKPTKTVKSGRIVLRRALTEVASTTLKVVAGVAVFIYLAIGAVYFITPSVLGLGSCK
jgi:hypothetical protein